MVKTTSPSNKKSEASPVVVPAASDFQTPLAQQQTEGQRFKIDFTDNQALQIQDMARAIVEAAVRGEPITEQLPPEIENAPTFGMFITLHRPMLLRACRGRWGVTTVGLSDLLKQVASDTATLDSRFPSITLDELPYLTIDISLIYEPAVVGVTGEDRLNAFEIGTHGLVIDHPNGGGLFLPHVAIEAGWDAKTYLDQLAMKAGLPADTWRRDPDAKLMTFRTKMLTSEPPQAELDIQALQATWMQRLLDATNRMLAGDPIDRFADAVLTRRHREKLGLHLQTDLGTTAASVSAGHSLLDLARAAVGSLKELYTNRIADPQPVQRVTLLWQPIRLAPSDYPTRHGYLSKNAVLIRNNGQWRLVLPNGEQQFDRVGEALRTMELSHEQWQHSDRSEGEIELTAMSVLSFVSRGKPGGASVRQPARAGQFYPADPVEMEQALNGHLAAGPINVLKERFRAVMLPHAGWRFCGDTIGKTLSRVRVPKIVIVIGPKHTSYGASWSVAPHEHWNIPGGTVPIATDWVRRLMKLVPGLESEPDAHRLEHGSEVLLPFLHRIEPQLSVVPIVMGQTSYEATSMMAAGLAALINEHDTDPLLVISSDMNHFTTETENRQLDQMALDAMLTGDPRRLFDTCQDNQISMCGLLPAVTVMQALAKARLIELELVDYHTSADQTGDTSRVVGYAGVLLR